MFDDQMPKGQGQTPSNLPIGEPEDMFSGVEPAIEESAAPAAPPVPEEPATPSALGAGVLRPVAEESAPTTPAIDLPLCARPTPTANRRSRRHRPTRRDRPTRTARANGNPTVDPSLPATGLSRHPADPRTATASGHPTTAPATHPEKCAPPLPTNAPYRTGHRAVCDSSLSTIGRSV